MLIRLARLRPSLSGTLPNVQARLVSQSESSSATGSTVVTGKHGPLPESAGHQEVNQFFKNPDYHGFSDDPVIDEWNMRLGCFFGISVALVIGGTFLHYLPDHGMQQWARREAERLILQREKEGLPLIEENYYDPKKIILPNPGKE
ncbi:NADH dehydrogenase [ubiquinone] 1 beta subcomplex subunit 11, mitochondrial [Aulostomus maculatus]